MANSFYTEEELAEIRKADEEMSRGPGAPRKPADPEHEEKLRARRREYMRKYNEEHREEIRAKARAYAKDPANKEKIAEKQRRYYQANRERIRAYQKKYQRERSEKYKAINRKAASEYYKKHKDDPPRLQARIARMDKWLASKRARLAKLQQEIAELERRREAEAAKIEQA